MDTQNLYKVSKYDFALTGIIILIIFVIPFLLFNSIGANEEMKALIHKDGKLIKTVNLSNDDIFSIDKMQIEIKERRIRILNSDCPKFLCKNMGWISNPGQTIICVPNRVLIEIAGVSKDVQYNALTY